MLLTVVILPLCDVINSPTPRRCLTVLTLSMFHIVTACYDQFFAHVLLGKGAWHQSSRDVGLMLSDVLYVVMATRWWLGLQWLKYRSHGGRISRAELLLALICLVSLIILTVAK